LKTDRIAAHLEKSAAALQLAAQDKSLLATMQVMSGAIIHALREGNKVLLAGNGGSAADAQHIAAEIIGRYKVDRPAWAAIALTTDASALTAIGNDYGFEHIFARQLQGLGRRGDVFIGLTTSGMSANILAALRMARDLGLVTIGMTGQKGLGLKNLCDHLFVSPSDDTPIIQQIHLTAAHAICDAVEQALAGPTPK
jgi:D-sedoheptulose 7-phosphate isomerase